MPKQNEFPSRQAARYQDEASPLDTAAERRGIQPFLLRSDKLEESSSNLLLARKNKTVYVAMSGGVDSSVAAALLKKQGFNIVGVFMKPWQPTQSDNCLWRQDREDAMRAATVLDIPLLTWDFSKEYKKYVTDYMIREYKTGRTPNPDVMCNKEIKFGLFFDKAVKEGADYIATGHYARLAWFCPTKNRSLARPAARSILGSRFRSFASLKPCPLNLRNIFLRDKTRPIYTLLKAVDLNKDQTYFLWTLTQKHLAKTLFPIGDLIKPEVRKLAKKFGLPNHDKKDSQGVCFIGPLDMKNFLKNYIKPKSGKILDLKGKELGKHDGVYYYTIGQRHGLNLGIGGGPYFVVKKDVKKNIIFVGTEKDLTGEKARIKNINWISGAPKFPAELSVRTRYRAPLKKTLLKKNGELIFKQPERAITSGQSAVFYKGAELLGGGIIK